jgi:hypothetical protein
MLLVKDGEEPTEGSQLQLWYAWQICTNYIAVRAKSNCLLYVAALRCQEVVCYTPLHSDEVCERDEVFSWLSDQRDRFMEMDIGY